jgi:hypothetical protein
MDNRPMTKSEVCEGACRDVSNPDRRAEELARQRELAMDDIVQGYRDGRDPDSPPPSSNRTASYLHGFNVGRGDRRGVPFHNAATLRLLAEAAIETDALEACR